MARTILSLASLSFGDGIRIFGEGSGSAAGISVSYAGDFNSDGFDDVIIGANSYDIGSDTDVGAAYVLYGADGNTTSFVSLAGLTGTNGIRIEGATFGDALGAAVGSAGDLNDDGVGDILLGAPTANPNGEITGAIYVVYGQSGGIPGASFGVSALTGANGFRIDGNVTGEALGTSVGYAGDINGDNLGDVVFGGPGRDADNGSAFAFFGRDGLNPGPSVRIADVIGPIGFRLDGGSIEEAGRSVSGAGDINADGIEDFIIGATGANGAEVGSGAAYVVFGNGAGFSSPVDLTALDGTTGFRIGGEGNRDATGLSVSDAGDINGDGIDDLIVGAPLHAPGGLGGAGAAYVIYGSRDPFDRSYPAASLDGTNGFRIDGIEAGAQLGAAVTGTGDINGDGIDDIFVGAPNLGGVGGGYVVYGRAGGFGPDVDLAALDVTEGYRIDGGLDAGEAGFSADAAGDFNNDGIGDLILGAPSADLSGVSYIVLGENARPIAADDAVSTDEDSVITGNVLVDNGFGVDIDDSPNGLLRVVGVEGLQGNVGTEITLPSGALLTVLSDGSFTYDPNSAFEDLGTGASRIDDIRVTISDGATLPAVLANSDLDGIVGREIVGDGFADNAGISVSGAGDVNGDGYADVIIGAPGYDIGEGPAQVGAAYVIFGSAAGIGTAGFGSSFDVGFVDGSNGFLIEGALAYDEIGLSVSGAGDLNGDGFDDVVVGGITDESVSSGEGADYVIYGTDAGFPSSISLSSVTGATGFRLGNTDVSERSGFSVSGAGDVNNDGIDDVFVGAPLAGSGDFPDEGAGYVVFGQSGGLGASVDLLALDGTDGFAITGPDGFSELGTSVSNAGDINNDGIDDLILGAPFASDGTDGAAFVIFGSEDPFVSSVNTAALDGTDGFRITGLGGEGGMGRSVSGAGDVNGDGVDDVIVGEPGAGGSGSAYVVFGTGAGFAADVDATALDGTNGFELTTATSGDQVGISVSDAGDVNGDGIGDLIVGARGTDIDARSNTGAAYIVYGTDTGFAASLDLASLDGTDGFRIDGQFANDANGTSVSGAGDINGDGYDDLIVGAPGAEPNESTDQGAAYVIYGGPQVQSDTGTLSVTVNGVNDPGTLVVSNLVATLAEDADTSGPIRIADLVIDDLDGGANALTLGGADAGLFEILDNTLFLRSGTTLDFETQAALDVTVFLDDPDVGLSPDDRALLSIAITDVNEAATAVALANVIADVSEGADTSVPIKVADIVVTDDALGTNDLILGGADAALFEIVGTELFLAAGAALDFETAPALDVTVSVDDAGVGSSPDATTSLSLTVTDANEAPALAIEELIFELPEDTDTSVAIQLADVFVFDDALGSFDLALAGADAGLFTLVGTQLFLAAGVSLDFEVQATLDVAVTVDDVDVGLSPDDRVTYTLNVTDVNEAPSVALANAVTSLPENTATTAPIRLADIVVSDDALGSADLALAGSDAALFEILGTELFLSAGVVLDFEAQTLLDVSVTVDDPELGLSPDDSAELGLMITDVNEPPEAVGLLNVLTEIEESRDTTERVKVADIVVTDDLLGSNALGVGGADAALFEVDGTELFLVAGAALDFETQPLLDVSVVVDDADVGLVPDAEVGLSIDVLDVDEAPAEVSLINALASIDENSDTTAPIKLGDIVITDDGLGLNVLGLAGADAAAFDIVGTELFLVPGTVLDFEAQAQLDVTVTVDDATIGGTPDASTAYTLLINDLDFEVFIGTPGPDVLSATNRNDVMAGLAGDDTILGLDGSDTMSGGDGDDTLDGGAGGDDIGGGAGDDEITGGDGDDTVGGGSGDDTILGGAGSDLLRGGDGSDSIDGGDGDDALDGGNGADLVQGGDGNDTLGGNFGADTVEGGVGDDDMGGGAGADLIDGGDGNDTVGGGEGADTITGGNGDDLLAGGLGEDSIDGGSGADTIRGDAGNDTIDGGDGDDEISGGFRHDDISGGEGNDAVTGDEGNDTLRGQDGNDTLDGGVGDDVIAGGTGNDSVTGGPGNDQLAGGQCDDTVTGGEGSDTIGGGLGNDLINGGALEDIIGAGEGDDTVFGGSGHDLVNGGNGNDVMTGQSGEDTIFGGDGNDTIGGGTEDDFVLGEAGDDLLGGGAGSDVITGGAGNDQIAGGIGNDSLEGGDGADSLNGGAGSDVMTGGLGADEFILVDFAPGDLDVITDFELGVDALVIFGVSVSTAEQFAAVLPLVDFEEFQQGIEIGFDGYALRLQGVSEDDIF